MRPSGANVKAAGKLRPVAMGTAPTNDASAPANRPDWTAASRTADTHAATLVRRISYPPVLLVLYFGSDCRRQGRGRCNLRAAARHEDDGRRVNLEYVDRVTVHDAPRPLRRLTWLLATLALGCAAYAAWRQGATYDEYFHLRWSERLVFKG